MLDNPVLDKLVVDLARAYQTFSQQQADDDNPRQAGAIEAIDSLLNFLRAAGVRRELYTPLLAVLAGLSDASEGRSTDILRKAQYQKGTSKKPIFETLNLARAAAAVTIYKEYAKWPLDKALWTVSKETGIDQKQLAEFRKNIGKGRASPTAIENYDFFLNTARSYKELSAEEQARCAVALPRDWQ